MRWGTGFSLGSRDEGLGSWGLKVMGLGLKVYGFRV